MCDGRILQVGAPTEVYEKPADVFTARFIGSPTMNIVPGRVAIQAGTATLMLGEHAIVLSSPRGAFPADVLVGVRPQQLRVLEADEPADLVLTGTTAVVEPLGPETFVHVECGDRLLLATASAKAPPAVGQRVRLGAAIAALTLFDAATERAL
jgi:multiple sugar transport system ATP-binding protein